MSGADHCEVEGDEAALWTDRQTDRQTDVQRAMSGAGGVVDRQTDRETDVQRAMSGADHCEVEGDEAALRRLAGEM